jgi:hypothetical protein
MTFRTKILVWFSQFTVLLISTQDIGKMEYHLKKYFLAISHKVQKFGHDL